jgi:Holliday junction resolvase RusA-like endonuclease
VILLHPDEIATPIDRSMRLDDRVRVSAIHPQPPILVRYHQGMPHIVDGLRRYTAAVSRLRDMPDDAGPFFKLRCEVTEGWSIRLEGFGVTSLNQLLRMHWGKRTEIKNEVQLRVGVAHQSAPWTIPPAKGRRRVTIRVNYAVPATRPPDCDNICKYLLDSLVKLKLLVDDSYEFCEKVDGPPRKCNAPAVILMIEDIEPVEK